MVCKVRWSDVRAQRELRLIGGDWEWQLSNVEGAAAGGMLAMVRKGLRDAATVAFGVVVLGRAMTVDVQWNSGASFVLVGVYNYGLQAREQREVVAAVRVRASAAAAHPATALGAVAGDWNFLCPGEGYWDPRRPEALPAAPTCVRDGQRILGAMLAEQVDVGPDGTTHCGSTECESRLDRVYSASPPWALVQMRVKATPLRRAAELFAAGISDHSPVVCVFADSGLRPRRSSPVPRCVFDSRDYEDAARRLLAVVEGGGSEVSAVQYWAEVKEAIVLAADFARTRVIEQVGDDLERKDMLLRSVARAVWRRDLWLACRLLDTCSAASAHLCIRSYRPALVDARAFAAAYEEARRATLAAERLAAERAGRSGRGRRQAIDRMSALWAPRARRLRLVGVGRPAEDEDGRAVEAQVPEELLGRLRAHWSPVFERAPVADESVSRCFAQHSRSWPAMEGVGPCWRDIERAAKNARDTAPGGPTGCAVPRGARRVGWLGSASAGSCGR